MACMEGPPFVNHSNIQEDLEKRRSYYVGVSGVATTDRIWAESQKIPLVIGGIRTGNLTLLMHQYRCRVQPGKCHPGDCSHTASGLG